MPVTSDAATREANWLASSGDTLPTLLAPAGPWEVIQAYFPRTLQRRKTGIYLLRPTFHIQRIGNIRSRATYSFQLKLVWPIEVGSGSAETDMQAFDDATELLIRRILGFAGDHSHGGKFLSVAENPAYLTVNVEDPERTIPLHAGFVAEVAYSADDFEYTN